MLHKKSPLKRHLWRLWLLVSRAIWYLSSLLRPRLVRGKTITQCLSMAICYWRPFLSREMRKQWIFRRRKTSFWTTEIWLVCFWLTQKNPSPKKSTLNLMSSEMAIYKYRRFRANFSLSFFFKTMNLGNHSGPIYPREIYWWSIEW